MANAVYAATMQSVWFSHDLGESWARAPTPSGGFYNEARCWAVATHPDRPGELLAGTDQGLYRWNPEPSRFEYIPSPMDNLHILQICQDPADPDFIVCGTRPAEIFISEDGGTTWRRSHLNAATECWWINTPRVTSIQFDPDHAETIWMTIEIDGIFRSDDRGRTWTRLVEGLRDNDSHNLVFLGSRSDRVLLASTEAGVHRSTDEGRSWQHVPTPESPYDYFRCLMQKADDPRTIFASVGDKPSGEVGVLMVSRDGGETFERARLPEPVNSTIWWIATHPADPDLIFLCTIFGQIIRSQDGGETWEKMRRELGEIRMIAWAPG